jgi:hypothetical protein
MNEITADTPFDEVKGRRKSAIALLQKVLNCTDPEYVRALTHFRKNPEIGTVIEALRAGVFDYRKVLIQNSRGAAWPPAAATLAAIELATAGELEIDSKPFVQIVSALNLDEDSVAIDSTKVSTAEELFAAVTGAPKKKAPARKKRAPAKKKAPAEKAPVKADVIEPEEEPAEEAETVQVMVDGDSSDVLSALSEGLGMLDDRIMARLDTSDEENKAGLEGLRSEFHAVLEGVTEGIFRALGALAQAQIVIYRRQEELDILVDPNGEFPELGDDTVAALEALADGGVISAPEVESEPQGETAAEAVAKDLAPDEDEEASGDEASGDEASGGDDDISTLEIAREQKQFSDDEFKALVDKHDDVSIPKWPEGKSILNALSTGKVRYLAERVGVPNAAKKNHKVLLISSIGKLLNLDE